MRKIAPVFFSTVILLGSASALAGDMNKKSTSAAASSQTANEGTPAAAPATSSNIGGTPSSMHSDMSSSTHSGSSTAPADRATVKSKKKQEARNDMRCGQSSNPGVELPKECLSKSDTGAAADNSTQGQSGQ